MIRGPKNLMKLSRIMLVATFFLVATARAQTLVPGVKIGPASATLRVGETLQTTITDAAGSPILAPWKINYLPLDQQVKCAKVSPTGLITAMAVGQCGVSVFLFNAGVGMVPASPVSLTVIPGPILFTESGRAIALQSLTFMRGPFTRGSSLAVFFANLDIDTQNPIAVNLTDSAGARFTLPIEATNLLPNVPIWQVNVTVPNAAFGDAQVCGVWKNLTTNCSPILIGP